MYLGKALGDRMQTMAQSQYLLTLDLILSIATVSQTDLANRNAIFALINNSA